VIAHITVIYNEGEPIDLLSDEPSLAHIKPGDVVEMAGVDNRFLVDVKRWQLGGADNRIDDVALFITLRELLPVRWNEPPRFKEPDE
jgi:hypothetical protein